MTKEEYKEMYKDVDFIQDNMQIYSFEDFYRNACAIKRLFVQMERHTKKVYQWYLYGSSLSRDHKNLIWDYLNDFKRYPDVCLEYRLYINNRTKKQENLI